ncbi:hypothetical protein DPMN_175052 [Dreissena polymorpha]|uniref:Uncharacterized protein n=1 Tax=Dreissena polymorpha TaxID=45954 RepID=A0A9D4E7G5_DREPO|nr:hypothetical protein DPMN_175052 [Dreissena polymorpha]
METPGYIHRPRTTWPTWYTCDPCRAGAGLWTLVPHYTTDGLGGEEKAGHSGYTGEEWSGEPTISLLQQHHIVHHCGTGDIWQRQHPVVQSGITCKCMYYLF